jgi:hypothetical protein
MSLPLRFTQSDMNEQTVLLPARGVTDGSTLKCVGETHLGSGRKFQ